MLQKEIQEAIEKSLPLQVGEVLKKRLEQADKDADALDAATKANRDFVEKLRKLEQVITEYKAFDTRNAALEAREKAAEEKERNIKIATLEFQLASEQDKTKFTKEVAMGLVRNAEYRKTVFDSEGAPYIDANGYAQYGNTTRNLNETKTQE